MGWLEEWEISCSWLKIKAVISSPRTGLEIKNKNKQAKNKASLLYKVPQLVIGRSHFASPSTVWGVGERLNHVLLGRIVPRQLSPFQFLLLTGPSPGSSSGFRTIPNTLEIIITAIVITLCRKRGTETNTLLKDRDHKGHGRGQLHNLQSSMSNGNVGFWPGTGKSTTIPTVRERPPRN